MYSNQVEFINGLAYLNGKVVGFDSEYTLRNSFLDVAIGNFHDRQLVENIMALFPFNAIKIDPTKGTYEYITITNVTPKQTDSIYWKYTYITSDANTHTVDSAYNIFTIEQMFARNIYALGMMYNKTAKTKDNLQVKVDFVKELFNGIQIDIPEKQN